jgi:hypothetical protein
VSTIIRAVGSGSGGSGSSASSPGIFNVRSSPYNAVGNGIANDTAAITAAVAAASAAGGGVVFLPAGTYNVASTISLPDSSIVLRGAGRRKSKLKGTTATTILLVHSNCVVEDIGIDGGFVATWGLQTTPQANKPSLIRVRIENCLQAGFVFHATQNALISECTAQTNPINYALYNGVANCTFINSAGANPEGTGETGTRSILIANTTDVRLGSTVYAGGNRDLRFIGGIHEDGSGHYMVELLHGSGPVTFTAMELVCGSLACVHVASTFGDNPVQAIGTSFALGSSTTVAFAAESGRIQHVGTHYTGTGGRHPLVLDAITGTASVESAMNTLWRNNVLDAATSTLNASLGQWTAFGTGGTATYDSTKRRMVVGSNGSNSGVKTFWKALSGYVSAYRTLRIQLLLFNIVGTVQVNVALTATPFRRAVGTVSENGTVEILVEMQGDETGIELVGATSGVSYEVAAVEIGIL